MANCLVLLAVALALVGLAMGFPDTPHEFDQSHLASYCKSLDRYMRKRLDGAEEATVIAEKAAKVIHSASGLFLVRRSLLPSVWRLADAWRGVAFKEPCSSKSLAYVSLIYNCQPWKWATQDELDDGAAPYAERCLTPDYMSKQLARARRGALGNTDSSGLESFLTGAVLATYRRDNPNEAPPYLAIQPQGDTCCRFERAKSAIREALATSFAKQVERLQAKPEKLKEGMAELLASELFSPCASYAARMKPLMAKAEAAEYFLSRLGRDFLAGLSQDFQDATFRLKFCLNLELGDSKARLVDMMLEEFKLGGAR